MVFFYFCFIEMMDANQVWNVKDAVSNMKKLARFKPKFIEEPTHPDDILGHAAIAEALSSEGIGVATGETCPNRVMFKQYIQGKGLQYCQIDSCRMAGLNEVFAVLLLAAKFQGTRQCVKSFYSLGIYGYLISHSNSS